MYVCVLTSAQSKFLFIIVQRLSPFFSRFITIQMVFNDLEQRNKASENEFVRWKQFTLVNILFY